MKRLLRMLEEGVAAKFRDVEELAAACGKPNRKASVLVL